MPPKNQTLEVNPIMFKLNQNLLFAFTSLLITSCSLEDESIDSNEVRTSQMFATFQVVSDSSENDVYVEAQLSRSELPSQEDDPDVFVRLVGEDQLWFSTGPSLLDVNLNDDLFSSFEALNDNHVRLETSETEVEVYFFIFFRSIINTVGTWYSARLPQNESGEYRVSLLRNTEGATADQSTVTLPESFTILEPLANDSFSRSGDDIAVIWDNVDPNANLEIEAVTTCSDLRSSSFMDTQLDDSGIYIINAGDLANSALSGECTTTINVRKTRLGNLDSKFFGGIIQGYQIRRVVVRTLD